MDNEKKERCRFIKTVKTTYTDIQRDKVDEIVNRTTAIITENGGKVITITCGDTRAVGVSTVYYVYTIVYEANNPISQDKFPKRKYKKEKEKENISE